MDVVDRLNEGDYGMRLKMKRKKQVKKSKRVVEWPLERAGPVPPAFRTHYAKQALAGDIEALSSSFYWDASTQGHEFWQDQCWNKEKLSLQGRAILEIWIAEVEKYKGDL